MIWIVDNYHIIADFDDILPRNSGRIFAGNHMQDFHSSLNFDAEDVAVIGIDFDIGYSADFTAVFFVDNVFFRQFGSNIF